MHHPRVSALLHPDQQQPAGEIQQCMEPTAVSNTVCVTVERVTFLLNLFLLLLFVLKVIKETEEFEKSLKELEFLQGDSTDLLKYARDVNCHFASKKCKDVIVAARKLMTSKMHNTVKVCLRGGRV